MSDSDIEELRKRLDGLCCSIIVLALLMASMFIAFGWLVIKVTP